MPVTGPEALPDRQTPLLASGGESVRVSAILLGAYCFPTTDSRDDVGFLGSLPLPPLTESKPVTPAVEQLLPAQSSATDDPPSSRYPRPLLGDALGPAAHLAGDLLVGVPL